MRISDWSSDVFSSDLSDLDDSDKKIFELSVDDTNYSFVLLGQIDHPDTDVEDVKTLDFSSYLLATDGDNDTVGFDAGSSEERRVGKGGVRTCRSRGSRSHNTKKHITIPQR